MGQITGGGGSGHICGGGQGGGGGGQIGGGGDGGHKSGKHGLHLYAIQGVTKGQQPKVSQVSHICMNTIVNINSSMI